MSSIKAKSQNQLLDRFIRYVEVETQSNEESTSTPSSQNQFNLLNLLKEELDKLGIENQIDEYGRLYAHVLGNKSRDCIGWCAHIDTASECSDLNVKPQVVSHYDSSDIVLGQSGLKLSAKKLPKLASSIGKTIICTDGTTLLGGDDKAGVAIIMEALSKLVKMPLNSHRPISVLFTPDEEIGRGPEHFDNGKFKAKYAYTFDGDDPKFISIENFNAKSCKVSVDGIAIHPGDAKGVMVNAILVLNDFIAKLPPDMVPSKTSGHEGFNHVVSVAGDVEKAEAHYILRNHDARLLAKQVQDFEKARVETLKDYPHARISLKFKDQYRNMLEVIEQHPQAKETIIRVYHELGLPFEYDPIRGGTDGATFSFLGCPCPNLGTGSYNHHSRSEFAVLEEMELLVSIALKIATIDCI